MAIAAGVAIVLWRPFIGGAEEGNGQPPTAESVLEGGVPDQSRPTPILKEPGDYVPPATAPEKVLERWANPEPYDAYNKLPVFEGNISGFRIYSAPPGQPSENPRAWPCDNSETIDEKVGADSMPFKVESLLPGTAEYPFPLQNKRTCPDGSTYWAARQFELGTAGFSVVYYGGELAFENDSWKVGYVEAGEIHGVPAVFGKPITEDGYGGSLIAWPVGGGFIMVRARDIPFDDVYAVAEGVLCVTC